MPLLVEQLIYTSFSKIGFRCLVSDQVPLTIRRAFSEQIVHQHWDTYNPPEPGFQAAYLHQLSLNQTLFGWLYNDGADDFGRSNIPYFICYYIAEPLTPFQLDNIFTCLETGPVDMIDRKYPPNSLENLLIPDDCLYEALMEGVSIGFEIRQQSHNNLKEKRLLNLFVLEEATQIEAFQQTEHKPPVNSTSSVTEPEISPPISLSIDKLEAILQELRAKPIGIEGVALVSVEGHLIIPSIGLDENSALLIAGTMLYLANSTQEEFNWQQIETISIKRQQGHIILATCNSEMFLLVKASKAVTGLLEGEIKRTIKKLNTAMEVPEEIQLKNVQPDKVIEKIQPQPLPELTTKNEPFFTDSALEELSEDIYFDTEQDIRYRGRRTNL